MSVKRAQQEIDAAEFAEWMVFSHLEPFGNEWVQTALLANLQANLWSKSKTKLEDWLPKRRWKVEGEKQTEEQMAAVIHQFFIAASQVGRNGK